jgi:hypothetical protein
MSCWEADFLLISCTPKIANPSSSPVWLLNSNICPTTETLSTHHHLWCIGITIRISRSLRSFLDFFCSLVTTEWTHFNLRGLLVCWSGSVLNAWRYELWSEVMVYTNSCAQFSYRCFWGFHEVFLEGSVVLDFGGGLWLMVPGMLRVKIL